MNAAISLNGYWLPFFSNAREVQAKREPTRVVRAN